MNIEQIIATILGITKDRATFFAGELNLIGDGISTTIGEGALPKSLRQLTKAQLITAGMTKKQARKLEAALSLGRLAHVPEYAAERKVTVIDDPSVSAMILMKMLAFKNKEHAAALIIDIKHRWLATELISIGTKSECLFPPEEVFQAVIKHGGKKVIIAHNHPSGDLMPSEADISLTRQMVRSGKILGIPVMDHLIIGNAEFISMRQETLV